MTDLRTAEISGLFTRWLERYSPPQSIRENERAQQDEAAALLGVILKFAPRTGHAEFTAKALDQIEYQMKTRAWPTKGELGAVCSNLRKEADRGRRDATSDADMSLAAITERMMLRGEPVGEGWLYGLSACELIARGVVDADTMRRYRSGAYFARKQAYGEAHAQAWQAEREAAHGDARAVWKTKGEDREHRGSHIPDKTSKPSWGVAA